MFSSRLRGQTDFLAPAGEARQKLMRKVVAGVAASSAILTATSWADGFQSPPSASYAQDQLAALGKSGDNWVRRIIDPHHPLSQATDPAARAAVAWDTLADTMALPGRPGTYLTDSRNPTIAAVWPEGQLLAAALDRAAVTGDRAPADDLLAALAQYQLDGAYNPGVFRGAPTERRLLDDNLWIALDLLDAQAQTGDAQYVARAAEIYPFLIANRHPEGGLHWGEAEPTPSRNAVSNLPAVEYGVRMYTLTHDEKYLALAKECDAFVETHLRSPEGLIWDNVSDAGNVDRTFYSYNQGTAVRADLELYNVTHEPAYLERAQQTAKAALAYYGEDDRLWKQAPAFNAIFFRNLMALDAVAPDPSYRAALSSYLDRAWAQGRDAQGLFDAGGIGQYQPGPMQSLDQAGMVQMYSLLAS